MEEKYVNESRAVKSAYVLPPDTNHHGTMFGGKLMSYIDDVAAISATRHARRPVVTASTDSVDFLHPINAGCMVCLESFVTWTHNTSMEVFVKVISENLLTGERILCTTSFLTFVAFDDQGKPMKVPHIIPQSDEEMMLYDSAAARSEVRKIRREDSKRLAKIFSIKKPWD